MLTKSHKKIGSKGKGHTQLFSKNKITITVGHGYTYNIRVYVMASQQHTRRKVHILYGFPDLCEK